MKRLLNFEGKDYLNVSKFDLKRAILASEGRVIVSESVVTKAPYLSEVTNAEIEKAFGADILLLNTLDLRNPKIQGVPSYVKENHISWIKKALSRPIGVNLEPVDYSIAMNEEKITLNIGRIANIENYKLANDYGIDMICLTGNPATGVSNQMIKKAIKEARETYNGLIIAGKMHAAGTNEPVMNLAIAKDFVEAGCDILLIPAPYTVYHFSEDDFRNIADYVRSYNEDRNLDEKVLIMSAIGTSQESADTSTIRQIALAAKAGGAHLQHIGDGMEGISLPENIYAMGLAIRGRRWQTIQMARSNYRGED